MVLNSLFNVNIGWMPVNINSGLAGLDTACAFVSLHNFVEKLQLESMKTATYHFQTTHWQL